MSIPALYKPWLRWLEGVPGFPLTGEVKKKNITWGSTLDIHLGSMNINELEAGVVLLSRQLLLKRFESLIEIPDEDDSQLGQGSLPVV